MRKLFRFKYEPCNGTCYTWCDVLPQELMRVSEEERQSIVSIMVEAHNKLCDNPDYSFGVDLDDSTGVFIAHFRTPTSTEIFCSMISFGHCVRQVCAKVLDTNIPKINGDCSYGDNGAENLGAEILRACVDVAYRDAHHNSCPCHKVA